MTDNDLIRLFLPIINAGLVAYGYTDVVVKQANQPTQQGANSSPTVYFYKVGTKRYGFTGKFYAWDSINDVMVHRESQYIETTFQIQTLVRQFPNTPNAYTAADLALAVSDILQSDSTLTTLNNSGVGILRVTNILNPYFTDDKDLFEALPSFDFVLTYQNSRVINTPVVELPIALSIQGV